MTTSSAKPASADPNQYATFKVGGLFFGIDVREVQEVLRYQEMTSVPRANSTVAGLINLRGAIVTAIDMRARLGMDKRPADILPLNVVVRGADGAISLLVDEIDDVLDVRSEWFEPPPDSITAEQRELLHGVYKLDGRLLLALSTMKVLDIPLD